MIKIDRELDRYITLLRNKIREAGYTQLEVQESLGWGRSYISQLLTKQKSLRVEQVLAILSVISVEPKEFFAELYVGVPRFAAPRRRPHGDQQLAGASSIEQRLEKLTPLLRGLTKTLVAKGLITADDLSRAVRETEAEGTNDRGGWHRDVLAARP